MMGNIYTPYVLRFPENVRYKREDPRFSVEVEQPKSLLRRIIKILV